MQHNGRVSIQYSSREVNPQFASFVDGSELVIICAFLIQLPNGDSGNMDVVYPLQTLKPIASQLRSRMRRPPPARCDAERWPFSSTPAVFAPSVSLRARAGRLDGGGRLTADIPPAQIDPSTTYELIFDAGPYWLARGVTARVKEVALRFTMPDPEGAYHMPVILSPNSYSVWIST